MRLLGEETLRLPGCLREWNSSSMSLSVLRVPGLPSYGHRPVPWRTGRASPDVERDWLPFSVWTHGSLPPSNIICPRGSVSWQTLSEVVHSCISSFHVIVFGLDIKPQSNQLWPKHQSPFHSGNTWVTWCFRKEWFGLLFWGPQVWHDPSAP